MQSVSVTEGMIAHKLKLACIDWFDDLLMYTMYSQRCIIVACHRSMLGGGIAGALVAESWEGRRPTRRHVRGRVVHRRVSAGRSRPSAF